MHIRRFFWIFTCVFALVAAAAPMLASDVMVRAYTQTRVRSGPGTTYSVIGHLSPGVEVTATGRADTSNEWLRITFENGEGWVAASVVTIVGDPTELPVVTPSRPVTTVGNTDVTATVGAEVNIRQEPGASARVVGVTGESGATFDVTGRSALRYPLACGDSGLSDLSGGEVEESGLWLQIDYNGHPAWVSYDYVTVSGDVCSLDEITGTAQDAATPGVSVVTLNNTNLRASNYAEAEIIAVIPYNVVLEAEARNADSSRIRVTYGDETGWIAVSQVSVLSGSLDALPVEEE
ncbi:MAG: SH3 domain-containing protein [Chloroflexi bacterium]|nr:SH3 domain-containing protein [Chloroflexota bacterium]